MKSNERLWFNDDKSKLLPEGHPQAASLYAAIGHEIPDETAERFGLEDGRLPDKKAAEGGGKQGAEGEDKQGAKGGNKKGGLTIKKAPRQEA